MKICEQFKKVWRCGYCDLQYIFSHDDERFYNCGVYGWNCDLIPDYANDQIITTGYRNMRGARIPSELIEKYSKKASATRAKYNGFDRATYEKREKALNKIKADFLTELSRL